MTENVRSSINRKVSLALMATVMLVFIATATGVVFAQPLGQSSDGEALFKEKCIACHTIGGGDLVGPDLQGVIELRTQEWLTTWISNPDQVLASGDPIAVELFNQYNKIPMPNLALTPDQVASLIAYLGGDATTGAAAALPAGDASRGKALFIGNARFENGGPQCMSCHSIAGIGSLGGGNLGPDLTANGYTKYGEGLGAFLSAPPTVTMNAVWKGTPLTPQEQADLFAFLKEGSVSGREPAVLWQIALLAIVGAAALIALAQFYWGKRLKGVRRPMIERALAASKNK
ncbi:MAG: c-type cytochrome [Chloroflexota bacterium]